jgi:hypothetical protein
MASPDIEQLMKRADLARQKRDAFASMMRDVYRYAMPERDSWSGYGYGQDRRVLVWDSTATVAAGRFANRVQQNLVPAGQRFARLTLPPELADRAAAQALQEDLERLTERLFRHIHTSNFDQVANEWAQDLCAGTGAILVENGRHAQRRRIGPLLRFQSVPSSLVSFDEGPFGLVEGVFYDQRLPARLIPAAILKAERDEPEKMIDLVQCTHYEPDQDRWAFEVILKDSRTCILERYYRTNPWIITRWIKAPGETHGRGPLTQALPDIRMLNYLMERAALSAGFATEGAWTATDDGVTNPDTIRIAPGAVIPVRSNGGPMGPSLKGLEMPGNFQLNQAIREELKTTIRQVMFDDPLPPEVQAGLTATEVIERVRRFQQDTGAFARLQAEFVTPLIARVLDILEDAGELAEPEFAGIMDAVKQDAVRVLATGPLAQAQDRADVQAVMQGLTAFAAMGQLGGELIANTYDMDKVGPYVAERMGTPHQLLLNDEDRKKRREEQAKAQQQQAAMQSPAVAQAVGALAGAAANNMAPKAEAA